jgi:hypothetical protein
LPKQPIGSRGRFFLVLRRLEPHRAAQRATPQVGDDGERRGGAGNIESGRKLVGPRQRLAVVAQSFGGVVGVGAPELEPIPPDRTPIAWP